MIRTDPGTPDYSIEADVAARVRPIAKGSHKEEHVVVGVCKLTLHLPENRSLKGKRQLLKSVASRITNEFNVSVAEVDTQDLWQVATIGVACVTNDAQHASEILSRVVSFVQRVRPDAPLSDYQIEVLHAL